MDSPEYLFTYSHAARRGHSPTLTAHGHRFDSELNRLAAGMGSKGGEEAGNAPAFGETVQARNCYPSRGYITSPCDTHRPDFPPLS